MKMTYYKKSLVAGAICALACSNLLAQEAEFDLSSQRLEIQQVLPVPGKRLTIRELSSIQLLTN